MPVSYDDVEERKLGRQAKIAQLADQQLEESFAQQDRQLAAEEQAVAADRQNALMEDTIEIINQMDAISAQGGDPMELFNQLPPELQESVAMELSNQASADEEAAMGQFEPMPMNGAGQGMMNPNNPNPGQPMMDGSGQGRGMGRQMMAQQQGQAMPQQQPVNITEQAKQIASLQ